MSECKARSLVGGSDDGGELVCSLPIGHDGPHYDDIDDLTWKDGKPDE